MQRRRSVSDPQQSAPPGSTGGASRSRKRRLVRFALVAAGIVLGLLVILLIGVHTPQAKRYVLGQVREWLATQQIDLQAASFDYNLLNLSIALDDVVARRTLSDAPAFARVAHARVDISLVDLLGGRYFIEGGILVRPDIHVIIDDEGRDNLPHAPEQQEAQTDRAAATVDYLVEHFTIAGGRLRYEDRARRLDVVLPVSSVVLTGDRSSRSHVVQLSTGQGQARLEDRAVDIQRLDGELVVGRDSIQVHHLALDAAGSNVSLDGQLEPLAEPRGDLTLDANLDVTGLAAFAGLAEPIVGVVQAKIKASGPLTAPLVSAEIRGRDLGFRSLEQMQLSADATYDATRHQGRLAQLIVSGPPGEVRGSGVIALDRDAGESELHISIPGLDLSRIAATLESEYRAASVVNGELHAKWPALDYTQAAGDAAITFTPTQTSPQRTVAPVAGAIVATARGNEMTVDVQQLRGLGATVDGRVSLTDRQRIDGALRTRAGNLAVVVSQVESFLGRPQGSLLGTPIAGPLAVDASLGGTVDAPAVDATIDAPNLAAGTVSGIVVHARANYATDSITLTGADVAWDTATAHASGRVRLNGEQTLELTATADQIPVAATLAALGQAEIPADGVVSLQADVHGTTSSPRGGLTLQGADLIAYGEPLGALSLAAALEGRRVELSTLRLDKPQPTGNATLAAQGAYDLDQRRYTLSVTSNDLRLTNLTLADGRIVSGGIDITASGAGAVDDPAGTAAITVRDLRVDEDAFGDVSVDARVADRQARVRANADTFKLTADADIGTDAPYATTAEIRLDDLDLTTLPVPLEKPLTGTVRARMTTSGELARPAESTAAATIDRLSVVWNDQPIDLDGPATLRYADRQLAIDWLSVRALESVVSFHGTMPLDPEASEGAIEIDASADLGSLVSYAPPEMELQANGMLSLRGSVRGSLQRIDPTLTLAVDNASVGLPALKQPISNLGVRLDVGGGVLRLSELGAEWGTARLAASGNVPFGWLPEDLPVDLPRPDGPAEVHASVVGLDLATLPGAPPELTGTVSIKADAEAPQPDITTLAGQATFPDLQMAFGSLTLAQQDTSTIGLAGGEVRIDRFALQGTAGQVDVNGRLGLTDEKPLEAVVRANMDLSALSSVTKAVSAAGHASLEVSAAGTTASPTLTGFAELVNGQFSVDEPQVAAQAVNLRVDLAPDRVTLSRLDGSLNGGTLWGSGSVAVAGTTFSDLDVQLSAADVALDVPLNLRSLSKADLRVTQEKAASGEGEVVVGGQVTIDEAGLTDDINVDTGVLQALTAPRSLDLTESRNPLLERVRFDVKVNTATPIVVDNNLAQAEIGVDVRLLGTPYETGLSGRVDLEEGSELILNERRYEVERGIVTFIDERRIQPSLDLLLKTTARDYDISIEATGTPDDTKTTLSSTPMLPEPDIMALLVTGRTLDEMRGEEIDVAKSQVMSYLGGRAGTSLGRGLQKATGLSTVRVEPNLIAAETDPGARLTVGQDLTDDLSLVYSTDLVNSSDTIWIAEYDVTEQFSTRAVRQDDASYRLDFRHDLQFGGEPEPRRSRRTRQTVRSVTIADQPLFGEEEIRRRFKLKTESKYSFFAVREGIRRVADLYRDRDYLQARVRVERTMNGDEVDLTLHIDPGPQIALAIEGDLPADSILEEARTIWARGVFDTQRADDVRDAVRTKLAKDRYLSPTITYELGSADETPRRVTFRVERGVQFERVALHFEGAGGIDPKDLEDVIDDQKLGAQVFTNPAAVTDLLQRFYREQGYLAAELDPPQYDFDTSSRQASAHITVREGQLFSVREVTIEGQQAYDTPSLLTEIPLVSGDPFFPSTAERSLTRIRQLFWAKGYNDVLPKYELEVDRDSGVLDVRAPWSPPSTSRATNGRVSVSCARRWRSSPARRSTYRPSAGRGGTCTTPEPSPWSTSRAKPPISRAAGTAMEMRAMRRRRRRPSRRLSRRPTNRCA
jgi:autotransporter translocation and assembly factor TamB